MKKPLSLLFIAILILASFSGCSKRPEPLAIAVVVGAHANAPCPTLNAPVVSESIYESARSFGSISIIVNDGKPYAADDFDVTPPSKNGLSSNKLRQIAESQANRAKAIISSTKAKTAEVNTIKAIDLAARSLIAQSGSQKRMIILDSGLQTTGDLNFASENLLDAEARDIVIQLTHKAAIPDLAGVEVIWLGLGDVAAPQKDLTPKNRQNLIAIWEAILTKAGARSVDIRSDLPSNTKRAGLPDVSIVAIVDDPSVVGVETMPEIVGFDETKVAFIADTTEFLNPDKAREELTPVALYMCRHRDYCALLAGTTASVGSNESCIALSLGRANAVADELVSMGVYREQLVTVGLGQKFIKRVPDLYPNGTLIESAAKKNRAVFIIDMRSETAQAIIT